MINNRHYGRVDREVENRSAGSSPSVTSKMTAEDWANYGPVNKNVKRYKANFTPRGLINERNKRTHT